VSIPNPSFRNDFEGGVIAIAFVPNEDESNSSSSVSGLLASSVDSEIGGEFRKKPFVWDFV